MDGCSQDKSKITSQLYQSSPAGPSNLMIHTVCYS
uniref:Uncharacterized protein n=1 Tax=Anguilla anguilla TaxID=7936 RepID=A0A0E9T9B6_ANGAN